MRVQRRTCRGRVTLGNGGGRTHARHVGGPRPQGGGGRLGASGGGRHRRRWVMGGGGHAARVGGRGLLDGSGLRRHVGCAAGTGTGFRGRCVPRARRRIGSLIGRRSRRSSGLSCCGRAGARRHVRQMAEPQHGRPGADMLLRASGRWVCLDADVGGHVQLDARMLSAGGAAIHVRVSVARNSRSERLLPVAHANAMFAMFVPLGLHA